MIKAIIFDLDGTLVQTEALKAASYARAAVELRPPIHFPRKRSSRRLKMWWGFQGGRLRVV